MNCNYTLNCFISKECLHSDSRITTYCDLLFVGFRTDHLKQAVLKRSVCKS
jgi:hypothetical protein